MSLVPPFSLAHRRRFGLGLFLAVIGLNLAVLFLLQMVGSTTAETTDPAISPRAAAAAEYARQQKDLEDLAEMGRPGSLWELMIESQQLSAQLEYERDPARDAKLQAFFSAQLTGLRMLKLLGSAALVILVGLVSLVCVVYGVIRLSRGPSLARRWNNWQKGVVSPLPVWALVLAVVLTFGGLVAAELSPAAPTLLRRLAFWECAQALLIAGLLWAGGRHSGLQPGVDFGFQRRPLGAALTGWRYYFAWLPVFFGVALAGKLAYSVVDAAAGHPLPEPSPIEDLTWTGNGLQGPAILFILAVILAPIFEEFFFRGFLYGALRRWLSAPAAMAISAGLFALVHPLPNHLPIFFLGMLLAFTYEKTGNLGASMVVHCTHNFLTLVLMGLVFL